MNFATLMRTFSLGIKSLLLHPLRSLLTVLGIFIGVASVIWLLAIGQGISVEAQKQIAGLGATNVIIRSIKPPDQATAGARGPVPYGLLREDYDRLTETIPTVEQAIPIRELRRQFRYADRLVDGRLVGCTPEYAAVTHLERDRGHFITVPELNQKLNVCVLSAEVAQRLFPFEDPLGRSIRIEEAYYVIVGIMKHRDPSTAIGGSLSAQEFSNDVYIPISTLWSRIGDFIVTRRSGSMEGEIVQLNQITLQIDDKDHVEATAKIVKETLQRNHRSEDYGVTVPLELLKQAETTRIMFMLFMGLIAAISLVVGGIGIMNIMLATVTERTREIGVRRALGAKRSDITWQFLVETVVLSVVGGMFGVLGGILCVPITTAIRGLLNIWAASAMQALPEAIRTVSPILVPWSIPVAFLIAAGVGVMFGLYPATRAAAMDPIEALRHE